MTNDNERIDDLQRNGIGLSRIKTAFVLEWMPCFCLPLQKRRKMSRFLFRYGKGVIPILMQAKNPDAAGLPDWKFRRSVRTLPEEAWN